MMLQDAESYVRVQNIFNPENFALLFQHDGNINIESCIFSCQGIVVFVFHRTRFKAGIGFSIDMFPYKCFIEIVYRNHISALINERAE